MLWLRENCLMKINRPSDMQENLPEGYKHIKAKAVEGVDILIEELKRI